VITRKAPQQGRIVKSWLIIVVALLILPACKRVSDSAAPPANHELTSSTSLPFSTKEPERYQATRIITFTESSSTGAGNPPRTNKLIIARDGEQRREEYEAGDLGSIVFLENTAGRFIVLTKPKLYADVNEPDAGAQAAQVQVEAELMSPDLLLNESNTLLQYQKLGTEVIAGRTATKYQVVNSTSTGRREISIWLDETLGMPIATQYINNIGDISTRVFMELQNIRTEVDPMTFALPVDYRKVQVSQILTIYNGIPAEKASPAVQANQK
jgi:hypothetical protein